MKKQEKGFSIIEIILVVAVVALLGFVGWRVWDAKKEKPAQQNTEQQNQQGNEQKTEELNPDGYLHIKELGVKIKLTEGIRDAVYQIKELEDGKKLATFSTQSLIDSSISCEAKNGPLGGLIKVDLPATKEGQLVLQTPEHYFYYSGPQSSCGTNEVAKTAGELLLIMNTQINTIETD